MCHCENHKKLTKYEEVLEQGEKLDHKIPQQKKWQ